MTESLIRDADRGDLDALTGLEQACFAHDAQSRRSLSWLVRRANARFRVVEDTTASGILAYALTLYRRGSTVARLYSIAVAPAGRGQGLAARLLEDAEVIARTGGQRTMRAEARVSNRASRGLFAAHGFRETQRLADYYPGPEDGVRLEKHLRTD